MPKIIIREYDETSAGTEEYANFSIVVPGFCKYPVVKADETASDYPCIKEDATNHCYYFIKAAGEPPIKVFDENGVGKYNKNNKDIFENCIGKKVMFTKIDAENAKPENFGTKEAPYYFTNLTADEFYKKYQGQDGQAFAPELITEEKEKVAGYRKIKVVIEGNDVWYRLIPATKEWSASNLYAVVKAGNEGHDKINFAQMGNQMAYELIGLGYTVLYKLLIADANEMDKSTYWKQLKDKSTYDFRYICTGGYCSAAAYANIKDIAEHKNDEALKDTDIKGRGDCVALIDVDETGSGFGSDVLKGIRTYVNGLNFLTADTDCGKYCAIFAPKVTYAGKAAEVEVYENLTFPASFHYLACAAYARNNLNYNEWYAVAGYTRGVCSKVISHTSFKIGEIMINALQPRYEIKVDGDESKNTHFAVNLIANVRGNYYMWGNRTAYKLDDKGLVASHFLNIRQLCSTIKKNIYVTCRQLTFDPNSDVLWGTFCNALKPMFEKMKADQGISDYKIIKVKDSKKALLTAKIRIVPIEAVEDFDISVYLEDSIAEVETEE